MKYSKNTKLNTVLNEIEKSLLNYGIEEIKNYYKNFKNEPDYNIAQYGNLIIYYDDLYNFYRDCGYKCTEKFSTEKLWNTYKRQVGFVTRQLINNI